MKKLLPAIVLFLFVFAGCGAAVPQHGAPQEIVDLREIDSSLVLDIRYATDNNFTGTVLYPVAAAKLRRVAAESLAAVQRELRSRGLGLKIFDGYRPLSIQKKLWEVVADPRYVADPKKGSKHNRGAAVDLTIIDSTGAELEMPTGYDDFTEKASHDNMDHTPAAIRNRAMLKEIMERHGFIAIRSEWWHYDFRGWESFDILDEPF